LRKPLREALRVTANAGNLLGVTHLLTLLDVLLVVAGFIAWGVLAQRAAPRSNGGHFRTLATPELANVARTSLFVLQRANPAAKRLHGLIASGEYERVLDSWEGLRRGAARAAAEDDRDGDVATPDSLDHLHAMLAELATRPSRARVRRRQAPTPDP
jgi:hypothetical protein